MFSDPQSVTVDGSAKTLNRTGTSADSASYSSSDRAYKLTMSHTYGRRYRHTARFQKDSLVANPLVSGQNINQSVTAYLVIDCPPGYDTADLVDVASGLMTNLTASTNANLTKLVGGES